MNRTVPIIGIIFIFIVSLICPRTTGNNTIAHNKESSPNQDISAPSRVDFYLDDELQSTDDEQPFEWTWTGAGKHTIKAVGYDRAGLYDEDIASTSYLQSISSVLFRYRGITPIVQNIGTQGIWNSGD